MDATIAKEEENYFNKLVEDLKYEIDVTRYYRKLQENIPSCCSHKTSKKFRMKSKSTQTDLDSSSLPISWLISCENLVSNLNSGISNSIRHCEIDVRCHVENIKRKYEYHDWEEFQEDPVHELEHSSKQKIHFKDLKQDLYNLLEQAKRLQDAFLSLRNKPKVLFKHENTLSNNEEISRAEGQVIDIDPLSGGKYYGLHHSENYISNTNTDNSDDFELNQDFTESDFALKKDNNIEHVSINKEYEYFKVHSNRKNRNFEEINTPAPFYGIAVSSYNLKPHPRSNYTDIIEVKDPKSKISHDIELNNTNKRNFRNRKGLIIIGGRITDPLKTLGETIDSNTKTSDKNNLQVDTEKHQDKHKLSNNQKKNKLKQQSKLLQKITFK